MNFLGIDFGLRKIGLALGNDEIRLAEPYGVVFYNDLDDGLRKILRIMERMNVQKVVVGVSEGKSGRLSKNFGKLLSKKSGVEVAFQDETLSTVDAKLKSIQSGIGREKRRRLEDAYAASVILQNYLDNYS
jgi:putative Holliday junction resolvase